MAKKGSEWVKVSGWAFLVGVVVAVVAGLSPGTIPSTDVILVVLGTIVGILAAMGMGSIGRAESDTFLLAAIGLAAVGSKGAELGDLPTVGAYLVPIVNNIAALVAPAVVIIALEAIWKAGSTKLA